MFENLCRLVCPFLLLHGIGGAIGSITGSRAASVIAAAMVLAVIGVVVDHVYGGDIPTTRNANVITFSLIAAMLALCFL